MNSIDIAERRAKTRQMICKGKLKILGMLYYLNVNIDSFYTSGIK